MGTLFKAVDLVETNVSARSKKVDILLGKSGKIERVGAVTKKSGDVLKSGHFKASMGWIDFRAYSGEPGYEQKEDLNSLIKTAEQSGFKTVCVAADTNPVVDHKGMVESILKKAEHKCIEIIPIGAVTKGQKGEELSEMMDMNSAGVNVFYDGPRHLEAHIIKKALQYTQSFGGLVVHMPFEPNLVKQEFVNEGSFALSVGLKGIPSMSESIVVARDLQILEDVGGRLHFANITTEKSVKLIRDAKKKGLSVTADTAIHYLVLDDSTVPHLNSNHKVFPPLRSAKDVSALIAGVNDGTIDVICTDHVPQNIELKQLEYEYAHSGISGMDTFFSVYQTYLAKFISWPVFLACITVNPAKILGFKIDNAATEDCMTLVDTDATFILKSDDLHSKSKNNPWIGLKLRGKVIA